MTPAGIEPATFRFVAQHLKHCATAVSHISASSWFYCKKLPASTKQHGTITQKTCKFNNGTITKSKIRSSETSKCKSDSKKELIYWVLSVSDGRPYSNVVTFSFSSVQLNSFVTLEQHCKAEANITQQTSFKTATITECSRLPPKSANLESQGIN